MTLWNPTHVQFTVLRARNLLAKGKNGNNDVFVTIQLGKEKYQTSTIKTALNPEWFEECDLPIPHLQSEIQVTLFHRGVLSDDFLGYASIPLWEHKITDTSTSCWISLHKKPSKSGDDKYRGELEVKLTFHCQSRNEVMSHGLKKRSSSIRNLASAFGDKFKLSRTRSFRENRRDTEGGNADKNRILAGRDSTISRDRQEDGLTRSCSMSAAFVKSMSLDRGKMISYPGSSTNSINNGGSSISFAHDDNSPRVSQIHSQSLYNLPGNRRSCTDVPYHQPPPPPYDIKVLSKDDSVLASSRDRQAVSEHQINSAFRVSLPANTSHFEPPRHERSGIYESIKERTEPENSASSTSDPESVPMPKMNVRRFSGKNAASKGNQNSSKDNMGLPLSPPDRGTNSSDQHTIISRDSGILEDRSSSQRNSLESSMTTTDGSNGSKVRNQVGDISMNQLRSEIPLCNANGDRGLLYHLDKEMSMNGSSRPKKKVPVPSQFYSKENGQGELVVRKRTRGQRDRLRQIRQGNRRYTVQGLEPSSGLYDENVSDPSDSSRTEVPEDLLSVFKNMNKEELLRVVITSKAQMIRKDQYIRDLENYIDDLLVRVMETTPRLLSRQTFPRL